MECYSPSPRVQRSVLGPGPPTPGPWSLISCGTLDPCPIVMKGKRRYLFLFIYFYP